MELELDSVDRLGVTNSVDYITVGSADKVLVTPGANPPRLGANDNLVVAPYQSATSIDYTIPQSVVQGLADVAAIREDLLLKLANLELAIVEAQQYRDWVENDVREQVFTEMSANYLSNAAMPEAIQAQILATDLSQMAIATGEGGTTASFQEIADRYVEVGEVVGGFTEQLDINTSNVSSAVNKTEELTAKLDDMEVRLVTEEGVSVGQFAVYSIDGVVQENPKTGEPWTEAQIGMVKFVSNIQYQYLGGALGDSSDGWVRTDASANAEVTALTSEVASINTDVSDQALLIANLDGKIDTEEAARIAAVTAEEQARIDAIEARILEDANLDGKITVEEQARIDAIAAVDLAYKEYNRVVTLAISDGVLTPEEQTLISAAADAVDAAKARFTSLETGVASIGSEVTTISTNVSNQALLIANLDGLITDEETGLIQGLLNEEQARIAAVANAVTAADDALSAEAAALTSAYQEYSDTVKQALIDGEITTAEQNAIAAAEAKVNAAKTELQAAIDLVEEAANRTVNVTSGTGAPTAAANPKDIYVRTDAWYTASTGTSITTNTTVSKQYGLALYEMSSTNTWVLLNNGAATAIKWAGGASKLLHSPDGAITGWSFGDGSNVESQFKIKADKFYLEAAGSSTTQSAYVPFSVDATSGEINFNGKVTFSSISDASTTIPTHTSGTGEPPAGTFVDGSTYTKTGTTTTVYVYNNSKWNIAGTPGALTQETLNTALANDTTIIDGGKITTDSLSAISANLGTINAGILYSSLNAAGTGPSTPADYSMKIDLNNGSIHIK